MKTLWTVLADYGATGEGHTSMIWVGYALDAAEAQAIFERRFGHFFSKFSSASEGIIVNEVTEVLLPKDTAKRLERAAGRANVDFYSHLHLNAS